MISTSESREPPVTICPPGKRAYRRPPPAGEKIIVPLAQEERLTDLQKERLRARTLAVALSQPHRRGEKHADDWRWAFPLWRFCSRAWPNDDRWRHLMWSAGMSYDQIIRDELVARGLPYIGASGGEGGGCGSGEYSTEEIQAMRSNVLAYTRKRAEADAAMLPVDRSASGLMRRLCYEQQEPGPYSGGILANALYRLADHLGLVDHGINSLD